MAIHEWDIEGFLLSPIFIGVCIALLLTMLLGRLIDRLIPWPLYRHEALFGVAMFSVILAILVGSSFPA